LRCRHSRPTREEAGAKVRAICNELIDGFINEKGCCACPPRITQSKSRCAASPYMLAHPGRKTANFFIKWIHEIP